MNLRVQGSRRGSRSGAAAPCALSAIHNQQGYEKQEKHCAPGNRPYIDITSES
jgi:hypothetical protein